MGWYDAFKGNVASVKMDDVTSTQGSASKNLGDAFFTIGKIMTDDKNQVKKDELMDLQKKEADMNIDESLLSIKKTETDMGYTVDDRKIASEEKIKKAEQDKYRAEFGDFEDKEAFDFFYGDEADFNVKNEADKYYQGKKDDAASGMAYSGAWKNMDDFRNNNPHAFDGVSPAEIAKIDAFFGAKDKTKAEIQAEQQKLENERKLLLWQSKLNKAKQEAYDAKNSSGEEKPKKLNDDLLDVLSWQEKEYGTYNKATGEYVINKENKEEAKFALDIATQELNSGNSSLSDIRKIVKQKWEDKNGYQAPQVVKKVESYKDYM